ncbi:MAG: hypothetical protein EOM23_06015 [Candidatus Moranbacteria bacterium]|nr:hypothetical protein [Candidatus Moranbacteria bacterium]
MVTADFETGKAYEVKLENKIRKKAGVKKFLELYPRFELRALSYYLADDAMHVLKL